MNEKKSMLDWMKRNEKKFNVPNKSENKTDKSRFHAMKTKKKEEYIEKIPQKSLDIFTKEEEQPSFYDEDFNSDDFKQMTKKWTDKNLD
ncbi:hypothetical protein DSAG12_02711 [Promethearchaeum syntrophicum]|uniref:Uncharacterized protein n=1 Tax=Promethearchaeum syntrophicum TaxID=2594042 RepID=A0A5B9DCV3_9ARCH|nr:hypothetical protein [Candidatus Prometheoarchaeum syntrophicum]QEE16881.1 hypothetical protein DSAG12_02711 [Candidatus Prometheoarchaeum syntrophicum]